MSFIQVTETSVTAPIIRNRTIGPSRAEGRITVTSDTGGWGWLPSLSLVSAIGLLLLAFANNQGRNNTEWAEPLFWVSLMVLFIPVALRLVSARASRRERIGLVTMLGLMLYLVKILHSPSEFTFSDEFMHWRTVRDITQSHHLFRENPLLPISALYPGMEITTAALVSLSGLTIFNAGLLVLGAGRLVLMLALYLFYEQVSLSPRVAGIASLLYMANPNFLFFNAQFAYESLALPLAMLILFVTLRRSQGRHHRTAYTLFALLGLGAVVITHHITSYALVTFFALWTLVHWKQPASRQSQPGPGGMAILALVMSLAWLVYAARLTVIGYVSPHLVNGITEVLRLVALEGTGRQLFLTYSGQVAPPLERLTAFASVGLILSVLPFGLLQIWRHHRTNLVALVLALGALAYPASLALRLTQSGAEASNRASEFLFLPVAFVLSMGVVERWLPGRSDRKRSMVFTAWATIIFLGGVVIGWAPWARLPGPYLVVADPRSIERQSLTAAEWARDYLGPGNRIATDRTNRQRMGSYGEQHPVTAYGDRVEVSEVFFSLEVGPEEHDILKRGRVRYLVVDHRLSSGLPMVGVYFEQGEPDSFRHTTPLNPAALTKFDGLKSVNRLFDGGDVVIYDVGVLSGVP